MTAVDDLVTWLRVQLDDDARVARMADHECPDWSIRPGDRPGDPQRILWLDVTDSTDPATMPLFLAEHIARWDPARVLAEIDAKRQLLDLHEPRPSGSIIRSGPTQCGYCADLCHSRSGLGCDSPDAPYPCDTVRLLAQPYADRPGWRAEWAS